MKPEQEGVMQRNHAETQAEGTAGAKGQGELGGSEDQQNQRVVSIQQTRGDQEKRRNRKPGGHATSLDFFFLSAL